MMEVAIYWIAKFDGSIELISGHSHNILTLLIL